MIERIKEGSLEQENFCLICHNEIMGNVQEHPLFVGGICNGKSCKVSIFTYSDCARYTLFFFMCIVSERTRSDELRYWRGQHSRNFNLIYLNLL